MKTYNSSTLSNNRAEVLEEAAKNGVIIQEKKTNGDVRREFLIVDMSNVSKMMITDSDGGNLVLHVAASEKV